MRDYIVTFETRRNRTLNLWQICVSAHNQKEAVLTARSLWVYDEHRSEHQFHIKAKRGSASREFRVVESYHYTWG